MPHNVLIIPLEKVRIQLLLPATGKQQTTRFHSPWWQPAQEKEYPEFKTARGPGETHTTQINERITRSDPIISTTIDSIQQKIFFVNSLSFLPVW